MQASDPAALAPSDSIYCPSCGASVEQSDTEDTLKCSVCGTEFQHTEGKSSEQLIARSDAAPSRKPRLTTEDALLERLKQEPPPRKPIGWPTLAAILIGIAVASYLIARIASKPDTFAAPQGGTSDSAELFQRRLATQSTVDSLQKVIFSDPSNANAHIALADVYYDDQYWTKAIAEFQSYLRLKPDDASARVDYAYAVGQQPGGIPVALEEIDTALKYRPDYLPGLYNGGILAIQQTRGGSGHTEALARAREYFRRAKLVADTAAPFMAKQIDTLLLEIDKTGSLPAQ